LPFSEKPARAAAIHGKPEDEATASPARLRGLHRLGVWSGTLLLLAAIPLFGQTPVTSEALHLQQTAEQARAGGGGDAVPLYLRALAGSPHWEQGWWELGSLLYEADRYQDAARAFGRLTRLAPNRPLGWAMLGLCEFELHQWDSAHLHLQQALAPANRQGMPAAIADAAAYHLGLVLLKQNNSAGALAVLGTLLHEAPEYPGLATALGTAALHLRELPAAGAAVPADVQLAGEAVAASLEKRPQDADRAFRRLITGAPRRPFAHFEYGLFLNQQQRYREASVEFRQETALRPQEEAPWLWLARLALEEGDAREARQAALHAHALAPEDVVPLLLEGRSFILSRQWAAALGPLQAAEQRASRNTEIHYALASVYQGLHRDEDAARERRLFLLDSPEATH